jgi:CO/xanthine dehydrogenase FAD-binding subunit
VDLNTVSEFAPASEATWRAGDAWLGGGSWLFSQPQPGVTRLLDLHAFGWEPLTETADGLEVSATCTLAELARWRPSWPERHGAAELARQCCHALLGSFKVHNVATVGGNICLSLPAGPMTSLTAALDGVAVLAAPDGGRRELPVARLVTGDGRNALWPGELLVTVVIPAGPLAARTAFRQLSLSPVGRSAVLVIARRDPGRTGGPGLAADAEPGAPGETVVTVTAATPHPVQLRFAAPPTAADAVAALDAAVLGSTGPDFTGPDFTGPDFTGPGYLDDVHGDARWRASMTRRFVAETIAELAG